jgi:hypothetical protein
MGIDRDYCNVTFSETPGTTNKPYPFKFECKIYPPPTSRIRINLRYYEEGYDGIQLLDNTLV